MNTNYITKIFSAAFFSGILFLVLFGISAPQVKALTPMATPEPIHVNGNPTCADINADNTNFPSITSNNGFSTGNAPNQNPKVYNITNVGTVTVNYNSDTDINFSASSAFITAVIVKAADGADVFVYNPPTSSGGPLATPIKNGHNAGLSHLVFCYDVSFAPTAATAIIEGRVQVDSGKLRGAALVTILNTRTLETQVVTTSRLGYYQFEDLTVGDTYVVTVRSKGFSFAPQTFTLTEDTAVDMYGSIVSRLTR